jgi:N-acetyl sugar amidotransferase
MRILIVCSGNKSAGEFQFALDQPFIYEQTKSLELLEVEIELFLIKGKGILGYLKNIKKLRNVINNKNFDIIHAHNGPSGFIAIFQRTVPVIITFHGSDINLRYLNILSSFATLFSKWNIFVSQKLYDKIYIKPAARYSIIPCGINLNIFYPIDKTLARNKLGLSSTGKYVLFGAAYNNPIKNYPLTKKALELAGVNSEIIELKNKSREEVCYLLNACDVLLLTSKSEGSPQVIKEAMACNCPIIATNVGTVKEIIGEARNCYITDFNPKNIAEKLISILTTGGRADGQVRVKEYDNLLIANQILKVYHTLVPQVPYQICSKTIIDTSVPGVRFDEEGVSNYCKIFDNLAEAYPRGDPGMKEWLQIVREIKSTSKRRKYNCIIGVSGGTDSSYLMHVAKEFDLNPLVVNLDNGWNSETSYSNILKLTKKLEFDLETYVIDYEEIKDLLLCYMKASLPWIDNPTDLAIQSILYKIANKEHVKYILLGNDFRSEGKQPTEWTYSDNRQLKFLHKKFGKTKLKTYPLLGLIELNYLSFIKGIKMISVYHYISYQKSGAQKFLNEKYDWNYYGEHHHENLFTKFAIAYWLPKKFNIDKRIITYSAQILSGEISRDEALKKISEQPFKETDVKRDIEYVIKKLGLTDTEFREILNKPNRTFLEYPSYYPVIKNLIKIVRPWATSVLKVKPKIFFEMEVRN